MSSTQTFSKERNDIADVKESVKSGLKPVLESGATLVQHLKEDTAEIAKSAAAEAQLRFEGVKTKASGYLETVENEVTAKPMQSVAIAFVAGALLSMIMGRR